MILEKMDIYPVSLRFKAGFEISRGKIGAAGSLAPHVLVRLSSAGGAEGWGESRSSHLWSYETNESVVSTLDKYLRTCVLGHDPRDLQSLHTRMDSVIAPGVTRGQPIAKSSLDIACHDLICREAGISLSEHLGGSDHPSIRLTYLVSASSPKEALEQVAHARRKGYLGCKIKIGKGVQRDLGIISACREAAGSLFLWADANQAYEFDEALMLAKEAARFDLEVLEQPLIATDRHGLLSLCKSSPVPIGIDESVFTHHDLRDFISRGFDGAVVIKTAKSGGVYPARRMIEMALESGLEVLGSGLTEGMIGLSASLQLFHAMGVKRPVDLNGPQFIVDDLSRGPIVDSGVASVTGPGLGVDVDPIKLKEAGAAAGSSEDRSTDIA